MKKMNHSKIHSIDGGRVSYAEMMRMWDLGFEYCLGGVWSTSGC